MPLFFLLFCRDLLSKTKNNNNNKLPVKFSSCLLANVTHCEPSSKDTFLVAVYNPISRPVSHHVRLPVKQDTFKITGTTSSNNIFNHLVIFI